MNILKSWIYTVSAIVALTPQSYLDNKTSGVNHPDLLKSIHLAGAFFTHCRHQQASYSNGSLADRQTQVHRQTEMKDGIVATVIDYVMTVENVNLHSLS